MDGGGWAAREGGAEVEPQGQLIVCEYRDKHWRVYVDPNPPADFEGLTPWTFC